MKKIVGVIVVAVVIVCATVFFVQKRVEDNIRGYLARLPDPYKVTVKTVSYSLLSNTLTISGVEFNADLTLSELYGKEIKEFSKLDSAAISLSGQIETLIASGFDAFAGEEVFDKPGLALVEQCVLKNYTFTVVSGGDLGKVTGSMEEIVYDDIVMRSDSTMNQMLASRDPLVMWGMLEVASGTMRNMAMDFDSGLKVHMERSEVREMRDGSIAEVAVTNYRADVYGQALFNLGSVKITGLNYKGLISPSLENPPLRGIALENMEISPMLSSEALKSIGSLEAKIDGDAVKNLSLSFADLMISRSVADDFLGDFAGMGYPDYISTHGNVNVGVDQKTMDLLVRNMGVGFQDGFDVNLELEDCRLPLKPFMKSFYQGLQSFDTGLTLRMASLTIEDHSFVERFKKKLTAEDMGVMQMFFSSDIAPKKILHALSAHFENPGTVTLAIESPKPISLKELERMYRNQALPDSWISVSNTPIPAAAE